MADASHSRPFPLLHRLLEEGTLGGLTDSELVDRFASNHDQDAFALLVTRHAPMVMAVCRGSLGNSADADDAFQATYLVLLRRIGTFPVGPSLDGWLYRVARRVSRQARRGQARRRRRESAFRPESAGLGCELDREELLAVLRDEVEHLPERYRAPILLCDLGGLSRDEAAATLGWPAGTVGGRLARGRRRLRDRLARRGLAPSGAPLAAVLTTGTASAVPVDLIWRTAGAATRLAAGRAGPIGVVSSEVAMLMKAAKPAMLRVSWKSFAAALLAAALTGAWAFVRESPPRGPHAVQAPPLPAPEVATRSEAHAAVREPNVERFQLANGLKVILRPIAGANRVALVVLYSIGENHDPAGRSGLGHLVEHLYLTTAAGGERARTVSDIARRYLSGTNAQTGDRYTAIATTFPAGELEAELKDAAARMGELRITADDVSRERARLLDEVANMFEGSHALAALNHAGELVRPTPRGGRRGGLPEHVRAITPDEVTTHWRRYYKPRNAIVVLAGDFDPRAARQGIESGFTSLPAGEPTPPPREYGPPTSGAVRELTVDSLRAGESTGCLAYRAPRPGDELYAPFLVLVSRLWARMDELGTGPGLPFPVYFTPFDDGTFVAISARARRGESAAQATARLEAFVARAVGPQLDDGDLSATRMRLGPFLGLSAPPDALLARNVYGVAFSLGRREQLKLDPDRLASALDAVTDRDLRHVADVIFAPGRHAAAFIRSTR